MFRFSGLVLLLRYLQYEKFPCLRRGKMISDTIINIMIFLKNFIKKKHGGKGSHWPFPPSNQIIEIFCFIGVTPMCQVL